MDKSEKVDLQYASKYAGISELLEILHWSTGWIEEIKSL